MHSSNITGATYSHTRGIYHCLVQDLNTVMGQNSDTSWTER